MSKLRQIGIHRDHVHADDRRCTARAVALIITRIVAIGLGCLGACSGQVPAAGAFAVDVAETVDVTAIADVGTADVSVADTVTSDTVTSDTVTSDTVTSDTAAAPPTCHAALTCILQQKLWKPGLPVPKLGGCMGGIEDDQAMQIDALLGCVKTTCKTEFDAFYDGGEAQLPALYDGMIERCSQSLVECVGGEGKANCLQSLKCMAACSPLDASCTLPCVQNTTPYQSKKLGGVLTCIFSDCALATLSSCSVLQSCGAQCVLGG